MALIRRDRQKGIKDFSMTAIVEEYHNRMNLSRRDYERYYRKAMEFGSDDGGKSMIYIDKAIEACKFLVRYTMDKTERIQYRTRLAELIKIKTEDD